MNEREAESTAASDGDRVSRLTRQVKALRLPPDLEAGRPRRAWLPWVLVALFGASTAFLAFRSVSPREDAPKRSDVPPAGPTAVSGGDVALEAKGYLIPAHQIQVSPKVSGMVVQLNFEEGKRVKKGDILAQLETIDYQADRDRADAAADGAWHRFLELFSGNRPEEIKKVKAELDEAQATREQLYRDWRRSRDLNREVLAPREYEQIFSNYQAADRRVEALRQSYALMLDGPRREVIDYAWAQLMQAEAELVKAQWRLDNCTIRAPVTGTVLSKKAEEGNIVNPIAFNIAASICEMADLSDLEVDLSIQERDIATVFPGQKCRIRSEAYPDARISGRRRPADADRRPRQGRHPHPREGAGAPRGGRNLPEARNERAGFVPEEVSDMAEPSVRTWKAFTSTFAGAASRSTCSSI